MKGFILPQNKNTHKNAHTFNLQQINTIYSPAKLHIPKDKNGNITLNKDWRVIYRFRDPVSGKLKPFEIKKGINRLKTITERKKAGRNLEKAMNRLLQEGFNPFKEKELKALEITEKQTVTVKEALELALKEKYKIWGERAKDVNKNRYDIFIKWLINNNLHQLDIKKLKKKHVSIFLNELTDKDKRGVNNVTRNSYRRIISSLFGQMVNDDIIEYNFISNIPKLKENPEKNTPFTLQQLERIKQWCLKNDPYLLDFMRFIMYSFLREVEVCRIKIGNINLETQTIRVKAKNETIRTVLIINPILEILEKTDLKKYDNNHFLFTKNKKPGDWVTSKEKSKVDWFGRRFKKLREDIGSEIGLTEKHTIYSIRHSGIGDLFLSYRKQGMTELEAKHKLMTITGHKSLSGLGNYLRDIGVILPEDYSQDYTTNF